MTVSQLSGPQLSGLVVHWHNETELGQLAAAWPMDDPRFELIVVDNGSSRPLDLPSGVRRITPGANLGFAGGVNAGVAAARAPLLLVLNPDAFPEPGALDALLAGFAALPEAAGLAPRLLDPAGRPQFTWQLQRLPSPGSLLAQALFLPISRGAEREPPEGAAVEQPAAAALALRREALERIGGFDPRFFPAWFEDVDLARRFRDAGLLLQYWPAACFRHHLGSTVPRLGFGRFLWHYDRNLLRYLAKHHGRGWTILVGLALAVGTLARLILLPLRRPRRARSRGEAARGLCRVLFGLLSGWRWPP
jgi:N-acetylglucosaminyl-diphospho-decaprenol L-rhamnosyltransferase